MQKQPLVYIGLLLLPALAFGQSDCHNVLSAGLIAENQTICANEIPQALVESQAPAGGEGAIEYGWLQFRANPNGLPQWEIIPDANTPSYQPSALSATSYFLRESRRTGCINWLSTNIITIEVLPENDPACAAVTAVQEPSAGGLAKVFPDPFVAQLNIQNTADSPILWQVFHFSGTKMMQGVLSEGVQSTFDASSWPSGVYLVRMEDKDGKKRTLRIVKGD